MGDGGQNKIENIYNLFDISNKLEFIQDLQELKR